MKKQYDFSQGERGKFYRPDAELKIPVYLDAENLSFVERIAHKKNKNISTVVNELIRSDKQLAGLIE
ncbi:MAG: hypothetical protein HOC74_42190 [Gemmatimonadetes bacterium]|jgi:hypothetical protein|nr:hypothetical protein [Gemmatimonadota bacterium]